jgi:hypothetical protein
LISLAESSDVVEMAARREQSSVEEGGRRQIGERGGDKMGGREVEIGWWHQAQCELRHGVELGWWRF